MTEMMGTMPADRMMGMDAGMMQDCIETCSAAAMAATMCADAGAGMEMDMGMCASMCSSMADVATTMMRMMLRPIGYDTTVMRAMMTACMEMGKACSAECMKHADTDHCRMCAKSCDAMVAACSTAMASMSMA